VSQKNTVARLKSKYLAYRNLGLATLLPWTTLHEFFSAGWIIYTQLLQFWKPSSFSKEAQVVLPVCAQTVAFTQTSWVLEKVMWSTSSAGCLQTCPTADRRPMVYSWPAY